MRLHVPGFYSKRVVNIGSVSIADYLVAEVWCDRMTVVMRRWDELCWNRVGSEVYLQLSLLVSLLCVCLHCTVLSAYTSVHNLATHMCHLPLKLPSSLTVGPLAPYKSCVSHSCIVCTCVDRDATTWFFIFFIFIFYSTECTASMVQCVAGV